MARQRRQPQQQRSSSKPEETEIVDGLPPTRTTAAAAAATNVADVEEANSNSSGSGNPNRNDTVQKIRRTAEKTKKTTSALSRAPWSATATGRGTAAGSSPWLLLPLHQGDGLLMLPYLWTFGPFGASVVLTWRGVWNLQGQFLFPHLPSDRACAALTSPSLVRMCSSIPATINSSSKATATASFQ
jgi:hypothetical protein